MTASPKAKGLLGRAGATVLETGDRDYAGVLWPVRASLPVASIFVSGGILIGLQCRICSTERYPHPTICPVRNLELLTARRMDITVWMSSPNDKVPAVAEAGSDTGGSRWTASPNGPGAALGGSVGWFYPRVGGGAGGSRGLVCFPQDRGSYLDPEVELRAYF
ncbi:hypothetical protein EVAR_75022_1 [Eumeta japonica]|uniref:Uncharacterized protein n=1 Tax=Eumeta variegata TaxID=151549 RepID=A0A4C1VZ78_EUMVA|nr:hypothetical protein EVAR_75022_1 [Eumeta japonica]